MTWVCPAKTDVWAARAMQARSVKPVTQACLARKDDSVLLETSASRDPLESQVYLV